MKFFCCIYFLWPEFHHGHYPDLFAREKLATDTSLSQDTIKVNYHKSYKSLKLQGTLLSELNHLKTEGKTTLLPCFWRHNCPYGLLWDSNREKSASWPSPLMKKTLFPVYWLLRDTWCFIHHVTFISLLSSSNLLNPMIFYLVNEMLSIRQHLSENKMYIKLYRLVRV